MRNKKALSIKYIWNAFLWKSSLWYKYHNFFWSSTSIYKSSRKLLEQTVTDFENFNVDSLINEKVKNDFKEQNERWKYQGDSIFHAESPVLVEPSKGLVLLEHQLVEESKLLPQIYPDLNLFSANKTINIKEAYYLEGLLGLNYFHFYREVISSLLMFLEKTNRQDVPIIVHECLYNTPYFQYILHNYLNNLTFIIQKKNEKYFVEKLYFTKASFSIDNMARMRKRFLVINSNKPERKIFLNRSKEVGRSIKNIEEILSLVNGLDFEVVDTEFYSLEEQIKLFSQAKFLIAIHGAGLTNLIFSNTQEVKLIEILPFEEKLRPHYYWLSQCLGVAYQGIVGSKEDSEQQFFVELHELKSLIQTHFSLMQHNKD